MTSVEATLYASLVAAVIALYIASKAREQVRGTYLRGKVPEVLLLTWTAMVDVDRAAGALWERATISDLETLALAINAADLRLQHDDILLDPQFVQRVRDALLRIGLYHGGKKSLIDFRQAKAMSERSKASAVTWIIAENASALSEYRQILVTLRKDFSAAIKRGGQ